MDRKKWVVKFSTISTVVLGLVAIINGTTLRAADKVASAHSSVSSVVSNAHLFSGEYKRYRKGKLDSDQAVIHIKALSDGRVHVEGSAVWVGNIDTGDVNLGELDGAFPVDGNVIHYSDGNEENSCRLTLVFSDQSLRISDDTIYCGGLNVTFNGDYKKTISEPQPLPKKIVSADETLQSSIQLAHALYDDFYPQYQKYMANDRRRFEAFQSLFESKHYFSHRLSLLLMKDEHSQLQNPGEITGLDFDPFTGAQEDVGAGVVSKAKRVGHTVQVTVRFSLAHDHAVVLETSKESNRWVVSNIIYPEEKTDLMRLLLKSANDPIAE